jgi:AraC family transcriptional regulator
MQFLLQTALLSRQQAEHPRSVSNSGSDRIAVLRNNQVVPLLPSLVRQSGEQPWHGVILERHTVAAIEIPEHEHRELCFHLQTNGDKALEWWSEGRHGVERTSPGSMILLPAGTRDRLRWQGASNRLILSIHPSVLNQIAAEAGASSPEFEARWTLQDAALQQIVLEMGRQTAEGWPLGRLYAELTVAGLASVLLRRYAANSIDTGSIRGGLPMPRLRHAMEYITANLVRDLSLDEIAREVNLSPFHFARQFRNSTGHTAYQYLLDQRIDHAKHLLRSRSWSVQEIAHMTGFRSPVNFIRTFSQRVGQTPAAWRKGQ